MPTQETRVDEQQVQAIAADILAHGHSLDPENARATWQRYGIEEDTKLQRQILEAIDRG